MATLSHEALRALIHRYGDPDEYYSEMIHAPSYIAGGKYEPWYVRTSPLPERIVWQLTGPDAVPLARAAVMIAPLGGLGLDLNMGCSAPDIARHGAGIAWMLKDTAETAAMVRSVRSELSRAGFERGPDGKPFRLGVKLRLGAEEDPARLLSFCRALIDEGVTQITLHPRTKTQKYSRPAKWSHVAELARFLSVPVYGNGDIACARDAVEAERAWTDSGMAGLMIGRGAVTKPWIFREIVRARAASDTLSPGACTGSAPTPSAHAPDPIDHLEVARFFLSALAESQPPEFQISRAHRFFFYYCDNFTFAHHIKMKIQNAKTPDEIGGLLERYFDEVPNDRMLYF